MGKYLSYNGLQYLWSLIKAKLDTKQDKLTTVQEANLNKDHSQYATKTELAAKQNTITDLASIRDGASKGSTALQEHQSLAGYATRTWVEDQQYLTQHQSLSGKQDVLTTAQLNAVNSGITSAKVASIDDKVDMLQHNTDIETIRNGYLPLSGGTMTGNLVFSESKYIAQDNDAHVMIISGDTYTDSNGSALVLYGRSRSGYTGAFRLRAGNGTDKKELLGYSSGILTWDGKDVLHWIKRGSTSGSGHFVFQDNLCIQYGTASVTGHATITMPVEMMDTSYYVLVTPFANSSAICATVGDRTTTSFPVHIWNTIKTSNTELTVATRIFWLAVYKQKT